MTPELKLRQVCSPDEKVVNAHKHLCDGCGTCWKHSNDLPGSVTRAEFTKAHECPKCGTEQRFKHDNDGPSAADIRSFLQLLARG
jgi:hypothetical protein